MIKIWLSKSKNQATMTMKKAGLKNLMSTSVVQLYVQYSLKVRDFSAPMLEILEQLKLKYLHLITYSEIQKLEKITRFKLKR